MDYDKSRLLHKVSRKAVHSGTHVHFTRDGKHYVASRNKRGEMMVFTANKDGIITCFMGVYDMWTNAAQHLF